MPSLFSFWRHQRGAAAVEFGLIAPLLVGLMIVAVDGWMQVRQTSDMREAVEAGARYYQAGGADDAAAQAAAAAGWPNRPTDGSVSVARQCRCGEVVVACSSLCSSTDPPMAFVTVTAQSPYRGVTPPRMLTQTQVTRVR